MLLGGLGNGDENKGGGGISLGMRVKGRGNFILWADLWSQVKQLPGVALHCVHSRSCCCKSYTAVLQTNKQTTRADTPAMH